MKGEHPLAVDSLIQGELGGKATAIARYAEMLWKIRTGYAVFLYGAVGIIAALVQKKVIELGIATAGSIVVLMILSLLPSRTECARLVRPNRVEERVCGGLESFAEQ